jgi:hypothetical protein
MENNIMKVPTFLVIPMLACGLACADPISLVLDSTQLTAGPGQQVTFTGTIFNNDTATVDLNSISISLPGEFTADPTPFLFGPLTVAGSGTTGDYSLFNVTVNDPYTDPGGIYSGVVTILGGVEGPSGYDPTTQNFLGSAAFSVNVPSTSAAPEPGSFVLLLTGFLLVLFGRAGIGGCLKRSQSAPRERRMAPAMRSA